VVRRGSIGQGADRCGRVPPPIFRRLSAISRARCRRALSVPRGFRFPRDEFSQKGKWRSDNALEYPGRDQADQNECEQAEQLECHCICLALGCRGDGHVIPSVLIRASQSPSTQPTSCGCSNHNGDDRPRVPLPSSVSTVCLHHRLVSVFRPLWQLGHQFRPAIWLHCRVDALPGWQVIVSG
jgi:hypothetical protein